MLFAARLLRETAYEKVIADGKIKRSRGVRMGFLEKATLVKKMNIYLGILIMAFLLFIFSFVLFQYRDYEKTSEAEILRELNLIQVKMLSDIDAEQLMVNRVCEKKDFIAFLDTDHTDPDPTFQAKMEAYLRELYEIQGIMSNAKIWIASNNSSVWSYNNLSLHLYDVLESNWINRDIESLLSFSENYYSIADIKGITYIVCYRGIYSDRPPYDLKEIVCAGIPLGDRLSDASLGNTEIFLKANNGKTIIASRKADVSNYLNYQNTIKTKRYTGMVGADLSLTNPGWTLTGVRNFSGSIKNSFQLLFLGLSISGILFIALLILTNAISKDIVSRTRMIQQHIDELSRENFDPLISIGGIDEFHEINEGLNQLGLRLNDLIKEEYKSQIEHQKLELAYQEQQIAMLQSQINPHFIVNTLEVIRMKLFMKGEPESAEMVQYLNESLASYAWSPNQRISIRDDMVFIDHYIKLQNYRRIEPITYEVQSPDDLLDVQIPRFIIQPVVENAVKYGFKDPYLKPHLWFCFSRKEGFIEISVNNNGAGLTEEAIKALNEKIQVSTLDTDSGSEHIGLRNVHVRIKLLYGGESGVSVCAGHSNVGICTRIRMKEEI